MQIFNNEIICYEGETFILNFKIVNRDGTPYVIPRYTREEVIDNEVKEVSYPSFFVLSISPTVYTEKPVYRLWVRIDALSQFNITDVSIPQFKYTNIVSVSSTAKVVTYNDKKYIWDDNGDGVNAPDELYELTDYLFSYKDTQNKVHYVYFNTSVDDNTPITAGIEYEGTHLNFAFTRELTTLLGAQSYMYDLRLISCGDMYTDGAPIIGSIDYDKLDIRTKQIIIQPTSFKVLYSVSEKGGKNS